jgi:putative aldouronate transport system permease protein
MKATRGENIFYAINYILLLIIGISCFFPLLHIMALSISSQSAIMSGKVVVIPVEMTGNSFGILIKGTPIVNAFKNSVIITFVGVALSMFATILAAYPLSRSYFIGRKFFTMFCVFTMLFSGGLIPSYLVVKSLGLVNTYGALWLPGMVSTYNMLIMRTFFKNIPNELEEAARIDGCGEVQLIFRIFLPLSLPVMATLSLFYGVSYWNAFMSVLIYIVSTAKYNLSVLINNMIRNQTFLTQSYVSAEELVTVTPEGVRAAGIMVMVIPMLIVYPLLQQYFVKGTMLGSIKG